MCLTERKIKDERNKKKPETNRVHRIDYTCNEKSNEFVIFTY